MGINGSDSILAIVPMFHANGWGLPYAALMVGASLVMPDRFLQPAPLRQFVAAVAKWQVPERWAFLPEVPKTSVGKFDKKLLRTRYARGRLDIAEAAGPSPPSPPGLAARRSCRPGPA